MTLGTTFQQRDRIDVDLSDPRSFLDDVPHQAFAHMREKPGLYWQPTSLGVANGGFWAVTRFADIVAVERDPKTFTSTRGAGYPLTNQDPSLPRVQDQLMTNDPPMHTRLREAVAAGFGPRIVSQFEPWVRDIVNGVLDGLEGKDSFDYVLEVAQTIPALVIARILGTPAEDREMVVNWTLAIFNSTQDTEGLQDGEGTGERVAEMSMQSVAYAKKIREYKRSNPAQDMFTIVGDYVDRGEMTEGEFIQWMLLIMGAGFETTHTAIGQSMRMYLENPETAALTDRALEEGVMGRAVDEYLRLITPAMEMARTATCDVEFAGENILENDLLVLYFIAANRDPAFFQEPERFDPWRKEKTSLVFGSGVHRCVGSFLAKLEIRVLFECLHERGIKLRLNGPPQRGWSIFINQLRSLPVARVR
jgi:cholest-4-en-3-one 26-monooxygenase